LGGISTAAAVAAVGVVAAATGMVVVVAAAAGVVVVVVAAAASGVVMVADAAAVVVVEGWRTRSLGVIMTNIEIKFHILLFTLH
jgi:hypothetical protein